VGAESCQLNPGGLDMEPAWQWREIILADLYSAEISFRRA